MQHVEKMVELLDGVKQQISDGVYLDLMNTLGEIHKERKTNGLNRLPGGLIQMMLNGTVSIPTMHIPTIHAVRFEDYHLETFNSAGQLHSHHDRPAKVVYFENGMIQDEYWYKDGQLHREGGPAYLSYNLQGQVTEEEWMQNGVMHRDDGPAEIQYYPPFPNGDPRLRSWWVNGVRQAYSGDLVASHQFDST
jgi:hypothetical protein